MSERLTTDKKVNEVTPGLWAAYPSIESLAQADPEDVRVLIREIGLAPTKSKNIVKLANQPSRSTTARCRPTT